MQTQTTVSTEVNPFALMMDPTAVLAAMERLDRETQAQRRICRPLDKPVPVKGAAEGASAFDRAIDNSDE